MFFLRTLQEWKWPPNYTVSYGGTVWRVWRKWQMSPNVLYFILLSLYSSVFLNHIHKKCISLLSCLLSCHGSSTFNLNFNRTLTRSLLSAQKNRNLDSYNSTTTFQTSFVEEDRIMRLKAPTQLLNGEIILSNSVPMIKNERSVSLCNHI